MSVRILIGDVRDKLRDLPAESVHCVITSPPYFGLRDYGVDGQIGLEPTPDAYIAELVAVFHEVRRVLRNDGTLWLNLGDSYDAKDLLMIPARVALALQADGWWLRSDIIWSKPNPMPESVTDRPTSSHEHIFLLSKRERYWYDADAVREPMADSSLSRLAQDVENQQGSNRANGGAKTNGPMKAVGTPRKDGARWNENNGRGFLPKPDKQRGHSRPHAGFNDRWDGMTREEQGAGGRNLRNVWTIATQPFSEAHFATFPPALVEPCIKAGCPPLGTVLDPFGGSGTVGLVADRLGRNATLIELNPAYAEIAQRRLTRDAGMFASVESVA